jgi:large subunit ribosomal protein L9
MSLLEENKIKVSKSMISLPDGPIKRTGEHSIVITLHPDVVVNINLNIVGEV